MKDIKNGDSQTKYFAFEVTHGEDIGKHQNAITVDSSARRIEGQGGGRRRKRQYHSLRGSAESSQCGTLACQKRR